MDKLCRVRCRGKNGKWIHRAVRETGSSAVWALMHLERPGVVRAQGRREQRRRHRILSLLRAFELELRPLFPTISDRTCLFELVSLGLQSAI